MSYEMLAVIGKMLRECRRIRNLDGTMHNGTFADILHGFAYEVSDAAKKVDADCEFGKGRRGNPSNDKGAKR